MVGPALTEASSVSLTVIHLYRLYPSSTLELLLASLLHNFLAAGYGYNELIVSLVVERLWEYLSFGGGDIHDHGLAVRIAFLQPGVNQLVASDLAVLLQGQRRLPGHPDGCGVDDICLHLPGRCSRHCSTAQNSTARLDLEAWHR